MTQGSGKKYEPAAVPLSGAIVAVVIAGLLGFFVGKLFSTNPRQQKRGQSGNRPIVAEPVDKSLFDQIVKEGSPPASGPDSAAVKVVVFSDFMCPYCKTVGNALRGVRERFGDKVQVVYREFPLPMHEGADLASEAALAAHAQGKYEKYHEVLFANQGDVARSSLERFASEVGLDMAKFRQALDERTYKARVEADMNLGRRGGVQGTPTLMINAQMVVGPSPGQLGDLIQRALDGKPLGEAPAPSTAGAEGDRGGRGNERGQAGAPRPPQPPPPMPSEVKPAKVEPWNPSRGPANAPVTLVVFCEYLCPFCKRVQATMDQLQKAYGNDVRVVFRNHLVHPPAEASSLAALAAAKQGKFEELHAAMFANQQRVRDREGVLAVAGEAGLDVARLQADMDSPEIRQQLEADKAAAQEAGAQGTPSVSINGRLMRGARPPSHFGNWIDQLLGRTTVTIPASADPAQPQRGGGQQGCGT